MTTVPRATLSAVLIAKNEAADLPDCLASLTFCDEIVVVENGSSDATVAICEAAGARVIVTEDWPGFGRQKQRALDAATCEWVLSIDADERVPQDLAEAIRRAIDTGVADGYRLNRRSTFLGKFLLHGGWYPDRILRLARRSRSAFTSDVVHERLEVDGVVAELPGDLLHHSYRSIDEVLEKGRRYAMASAAARRARGKSGGLASAVLRAKWAFIRHYLIKRGFLDGRHGFVAALAKAQETFWRWLSVGWEK